MTVLFAAILMSVTVDAAFLLIAVRMAVRNGLYLRLTHPAIAGVCITGLALQSYIVCRGFPTGRIDLCIGLGVALVAGIVDAQTGYVFDAMTLPAAVAIAVCSTLHGSVLPALAGAGCSGGVLAALYIVTLGRGLGLGDVKLACCTGAVLGAAAGVMSLGVAFVAGGAYAVYALVVRGAHRRECVPFAPYLAAGMFAVAARGLHL